MGEDWLDGKGDRWIGQALDCYAQWDHTMISWTINAEARVDGRRATKLQRHCENGLARGARLQRNGRLLIIFDWQFDVCDCIARCRLCMVLEEPTDEESQLMKEVHPIIDFTIHK